MPWRVRGEWEADVVLFTMEFWPGLADGSITVTFRRWSRAQVKLGGSYRTPAGVMIRVTGLKQQRIAAITKADAARCGQPANGCSSISAARPTSSCGASSSSATARIRVSARRERDSMSDAELRDVLTRRTRLDPRGEPRPLDRRRAAHHRRAARRAQPDLSRAAHGMETAPFKLDVRKLKALGLTESLKIGYRISPRGRTVLTALDAA